MSDHPAHNHELPTRWIDTLDGAFLAKDSFSNLTLGETRLLADYANYLLGYGHGRQTTIAGRSASMTKT